MFRRLTLSGEYHDWWDSRVTERTVHVRLCMGHSFPSPLKSLITLGTRSRTPTPPLGLPVRNRRTKSVRSLPSTTTSLFFPPSKCESLPLSSSFSLSLFPSFTFSSPPYITRLLLRLPRPPPPFLFHSLTFSLFLRVSTSVPLLSLHRTHPVLPHTTPNSSRGRTHPYP